MRITYLKPTARWAKTAKTFNGPSRDQKTSDYNLGTHFTYEENSYSNLEEFAYDLTSRQNEILIYGKPGSKAELAVLSEGRVKRRTENFSYPEKQTLHCIDIDGWPISESVRESIGVQFGEPDTMGQLVNQLLRNEGFDIFADADKVIVLTSSQWGLQQLNCHIYVRFSEPVRVEAMREFATALAKINQRTVFDPAVYKAVQPQFFTPPTCVGFLDPLQGKRIWHRAGQGRGKVDTKEFQTLVNTTLQQAEWSPDASTQNLPSIGTTWLDTIHNHVGNERGINEPAYRAAAQLVQSVGRQHVISHIHEYAKQMFDAVWETLAINGSDRGTSQKDKQTYDIARFRQYLKSATEKHFGAHTDQLVATVNEAITTNDMNKLTGVPVIAALCELKAQHKPHFIQLKARIKAETSLGMQDMNSLLKSGYASADPSTETNSSMLWDGGDSFAENDLIDTVLAQYDYIRDTYGNRFASVPGNGDGGYRMIRVDGGLIDVFFVDGLRLSGNKVSSNFGKKVLSKVLGVETRAIESTFKKERIGLRVMPEGQMPDTPTWVNLGQQSDGVFRSAKITTEGVAILTHQDTNVKWMHGTAPLYIATNEAIAERFGDDPDLIPYLLETLPLFIGVEKDDLLKMLMWCCSVFADKTLAYIAEIVGPSGTGKSTAADLLKDLLDPSGMELGVGADRTMFNGINNDFISDVEKRHVTIIDNVSKLKAKDQDILCTVCTGLRKTERILYTQQQMERVVRRHLIITALAPVVTRTDLRSRVVEITLSKPPYDKRYLETWVEEKPFLVSALLQLTSRTLKLYNKTDEKPDDIEARDVFLASVHSALEGRDTVDYDFVRAFRLAEAWDSMYDSGFLRLFNAFLNDQYTDKATFTTRGLHRKLDRWAVSNAGKDFDGYTVDINSVPATGRGMGWELTKGVGILSKTSNWKYDGQIKLTNGKKYSFVKKPLDTLDSLL